MLICILSYLPIIYAVILSLYNGRGNELQFGGFSNYWQILHDETFITTIWNSFLFTIIIVPIIVALSIFLALRIYNVKSRKLQDIFITLLFIPCITSPVAYSLFYKQLAYSDGIISNMLRSLNLVSSSYNILQDVWGARLLIIFVCIWAWSGYYILIILLAMRNIDPTLYKAAKIDGASNFTITQKIILPTIKPILALITVLISIGTFQLYIESSIITKGGPGMSTFTLVNYLYKKSFYYVSQYGYSSAMAIIIFAICVLLSSFLMFSGRENER